MLDINVLDRINSGKSDVSDFLYLKTYFEDLLDTSIPEGFIGDVVRNVELCNTQIVGRNCCSVMDLISLSVTLYKAIGNFDRISIGETISTIEIGSLFGGSAIVASSILAKFKNNIYENVLIDPLNGYYGETVDPSTNLEVSELLLKKNLEKFLVKNTTLLKEYSTSETALNEVCRRKVASVFIDGDHSYAGVTRDWQIYSRLVEVGGVVLIDNARDLRWPSVQIAIERLKRKAANDWQFVDMPDNLCVAFRKTEVDLEISDTVTAKELNVIESTRDLLLAEQRAKQKAIIQGFQSRVEKLEILESILSESGEVDYSLKVALWRSLQPIMSSPNPWLLRQKEDEIQVLQSKLLTQEKESKEHLYKVRSVLEKKRQKVENLSSAQQKTIENRDATIIGKRYLLSKMESLLAMIEPTLNIKNSIKRKNKFEIILTDIKDILR